MLDHLEDIGKLDGLELKNFTLSTNPEEDFENVKFDDNNENAFVLHGSDGNVAGEGQIFINAKGAMFQGAIGNSKDASASYWILYGASALKHEQSHRDRSSELDRKSEALAYASQAPILSLFRSQFQSPTFFKKSFDKVVRRSR